MDTKITKYIELVYSEKSELNKIIDMDERKKTACIMCKMDYESDPVKDIVNMKNVEVREAIFKHLVSQNSHDYILLVSDEHLFIEMQRRQMEPLESDLKDLDLKNKLSEKSEELLARIKQRYQTIFLSKDEIELAESKIKLLRPEHRLKKKSA